MKLLKATLLLASASVGTAAFAQVHVQGEVQIWKRPCESMSVCDTSFTASPRLPIDTVLATPPSDRELSTYEDRFSFQETNVLFQTFWRLGTEEIDGYLTHQISVSLGEGEQTVPLARCSVYQDVSSPAFPVGACTGFHQTGDKLYEYGVTLWKVEADSAP